MSERYRPYTERVDEQTDPEKPAVPASDAPARPEYNLPPEVVEARRDFGRRYVKENRARFAVVAGDNSIEYEMGDWFMIDLKHGKVYLSEEIFITGPEKGWSLEQIDWAVNHELAHFRDLRENPKKMLENFQYMWDRAADLAPEVLEILRKKLPPGKELPAYLTAPVPTGEGDKTIPYIETWLYKEIHRLYNGTDDMYVNVTLTDRSPIYRPKNQHGPAIHRLYRDILFPTDPEKKGKPPEPLQAADYEKSPKSAQLGDYLLRRRMVPDQEILISPVVRQALDGYPGPVFEAQGITFKDYVDSITDPKSRDAKDPEWRYKRIRETVEPVWLEFFLKDLEEIKFNPPPPSSGGKGKKGKDKGKPGDGPPQPGEPEKGKGKPGEEEGEGEGEEDDENDGNPWREDDKNPEPIDMQVVKDFIKQQKEKEKTDAEEKKEKEKFNRMTWQEKDLAAKKIRDKKIAELYEIDPTWAEAYGKLEESIEPYRRQLEGVFEGFMKAIEARMMRFLLEGFRSGKFNTESFINKYGIDVANEDYGNIPWDALTVYSQEELESRFEIKPNEIAVRLVIDGSGSMHDGQRIEAAKQLCVLFLEAFSSFEATMNQRFRMRNPLKVNTEVWIFGAPGDAKVIKPFEDATDAKGAKIPGTERAKRFRMMGELQKSTGGTCDSEALWMVEQSVSKDREDILRQGKAIEFLFMVTDGGSFSASKEGAHLLKDVPANEEVEHDGKKFSVHKQAMQDSRNALEALRRKGAHTDAGEQFDGIIARGFQIGNELNEDAFRDAYNQMPTPEGETKPPYGEWRKANPSLPGSFLADWESYQFKSVWGEHGANVPHPKDLAPAAAVMFEEEFKKLQIKIRYYEVEEDDEDGDDVP